MPVKTGIHNSLKFLDSGSRRPDYDPRLPGMTMHFSLRFGERTLILYLEV
jgi:hypothetical protein